MKIKNLNVNKDFIPFAICATLVLGAAVPYYTHVNTEQVTVNEIAMGNTFTNENGEICHTFDVGEHKIKITSNDMYSHKIEKVEGYEIDEVEVIAWKAKNKTVYVNTEPVTAIATINKDGTLEFNQFGEIENKQIKTK